MLSPGPVPDLDKSLRAAQQGAIVFGAGLTIWGIAPVVVDRLASRTAPDVELLLFGLAVSAIGMSLVGLGSFIRRARPWALWTNAIVSGLVLVSSLSAAWTDTLSAPIFPILLSATAAVPGVLALLAIQVHPEARPPWGGK